MTRDDALSAWLRGELRCLPMDCHEPAARLRVIERDGIKFVQRSTSDDTYPYSVFFKIYKFAVRARRDRFPAFARMRILPYSMHDVSASHTGDLSIGCQTIPWSEISAAAVQLGITYWPRKGRTPHRVLP